MALKRVNFATAHNASEFTSARWNFQPVPDGFGNAPIQLVEIAPGNPRFAYDPATGEPKGLLIEEQRTNVITGAQSVRPAWGTITVEPSELIVGANQVLLEQDPLEGSAAVARYLLPTQFDETLEARSVFVKKSNSDWVFVRSNSGVANLCGAYFNIETGEVGNQFRCTAEIIPIGGGWYWLKIKPNQLVGDNNRVNVYVAADNSSADSNSGIPRDENGSVRIFNPQCCEGDFIGTSPIITNGTAVTRTADIVARTLGAEFNTNEGTFVVEWEVGAFLSSGGVIFSVGSSNADRLMLQITSSGVFAFIQDSSVVSLVDSGLPEDIMRVAISYSIGNPSKWSYNGLPTITLGGAKSPFLNNPSMAVGDRAWALGSDTYAGKFKLVKYEPRAVSDAELQELSKL